MPLELIRNFMGIAYLFNAHDEKKLLEIRKFYYFAVVDRFIAVYKCVWPGGCCVVKITADHVIKLKKYLINVKLELIGQDSLQFIV